MALSLSKINTFEVIKAYNPTLTEFNLDQKKVIGWLEVFLTSRYLSDLNDYLEPTPTEDNTNPSKAQQFSAELSLARVIYNDLQNQSINEDNVAEDIHLYISVNCRSNGLLEGLTVAWVQKPLDELAFKKTLKKCVSDKGYLFSTETFTNHINFDISAWGGVPKYVILGIAEECFKGFEYMIVDRFVNTTFLEKDKPVAK